MISVLMMLNEEYGVKRPIDDRIILNIAEGDMDAFHHLYEQTSSSVYGFALSITKNTHDAEDVLQETFLSVYGKAPDYEPHGKPMAWILTIAKNAALTKLRKANRTEELDDTRTLIESQLSVIQSTEHKLIIERVFQVLADDEKQIVMLHAVSGLKHREIASLLGLPTGTVLSKYNRAIKRLKLILKGDDVL